MLLLLLGFLPPAAESSSSASASSTRRPCFCFSFFLSNEDLLLLILDSGDDGVNVGLFPLAGEALAEIEFLGDLFPLSSDGVRDRLGGDLLGISDLNLSVGVCGGGVFEEGGVLENGDLDGDLEGTVAVILENTGVEVRDGGRGVISDSGCTMLFNVLVALTALTCVDSGEGIRSITYDWSLDGAISWE